MIKLSKLRALRLMFHCRKCKSLDVSVLSCKSILCKSCGYVKVGGGTNNE
jgi:ribosomal protein L37AE/L43A